MITTDDLSKIFETDSGKVMALRGLSISIKKGEFVAIEGPSGSGKSTLLNIIGCLDTLSSGKVLIDGVDIDRLDEKELTGIRARKIGFIFQDYNLLPILSGAENVMLPMRLGSIPKEKRRERALELLKSVGMKKRADHRPSQMSGGERQRVALVRALVNDPDIILADEPTGNLDSKVGRKIMKLFRDLNERTGKTIVVVTHDRAMSRYARRRILLEDGKLVKDTGQKDLGEPGKRADRKGRKGGKKAGGETRKGKKEKGKKDGEKKMGKKKRGNKGKRKREKKENAGPDPGDQEVD